MKNKEKWEKWCHSKGMEETRVVSEDMVSVELLKECFDDQQKKIDSLDKIAKKAVDYIADYGSSLIVGELEEELDKVHNDHRKKATIIDPPSGWKYGFPKVMPDNVNLREWLLGQGYPKKDIELAMKYSRYWEEEVEED